MRYTPQLMPNAQCPMPYAPCPMPHAPCPMPARAPHVTEKGVLHRQQLELVCLSSDFGFEILDFGLMVPINL